MFFEVLKSACEVVKHYFSELSKAIVFPFAAYLILDLLLVISSNTLVSYALLFLTIVAQVLLAITTHRMVLLGPDSESEWGITTWSKRETYFLMHVIAFFLMMSLVSLLSYIPILGLILGAFIILWAFGRLTLVFPAIAVGNNISFDGAWKLSENYKLLMFLVVFVLPVLMASPILLISLLPYSTIMVSVASIIALTFQIIVLSKTYDYIMRETHGDTYQHSKQ